MASELEIINSGLSKLGTDRITSRADNCKAAREMDTRYDSIRDAELRRRTWRFACARAELSAMAEAPAFGFARQFQLPVDCLRVLQVGDYAAVNLADSNGADDSPYMIEGRVILTDLAAPLRLRYVKRPAATGDYDAAFAEALASRLAYDLCEAITGSSGKRDDALRDYKLALAEAIECNALEVPAVVLADGTWITGRD